MAKLRKIKEYTSYNGRYVAKVYRDTEWDEFRVKFYKRLSNFSYLELDRSHVLHHMPNGDYHTTDKGDAIDTARCQIEKFFD